MVSTVLWRSYYASSHGYETAGSAGLRGFIKCAVNSITTEAEENLSSKRVGFPRRHRCAVVVVVVYPVKPPPPEELAL